MFPWCSGTDDESVCGVGYGEEEFSCATDGKGKSSPCWKRSAMGELGRVVSWKHTSVTSIMLATSGKRVIPAGFIVTQS